MTAEATEPPKAPKAPGRGVARRLARLAVSLVGTVLLLVCIAVIGLQTGAAKRRLAQEIEKAVAETGALTLKIGSIEGFLPFNVVVRDAVLSDAQGRIVELGALRATLRPEALLDRHVALSDVTLSGVILHRLPPSGPDTAEPAAMPALPALPVGVTISRFALTDGRIAKPVLGRAIALEASGTAALQANGEALRLTLAARWDGGVGEARIRGAYVPAQARLSLDATVSEKKDGLLPALAGLPDRPAYQVTLTGAGPLNTWRGRIKAAVTDTALVPAEVAPLTGRDITLSGEVGLEKSNVLRFRRIRLRAGKVTVTAEGALRERFQQIEAKATYRIADLAPHSAAAGTALAGRLSGTATVSGAIERPEIAVTFEGKALAIADFRPSLLKGTVTLSGLPERIAGKLTLDAAARGVATKLQTDFALNGATALALRNIAATAGGLRATGQADIALDSGLATGALQLRAADIAQAARLAGIEAKGGLDAKITLSAANGKQGAAIDGRLTRLDVKQDGQRVTIAKLAVTGRTADVMADPQGAVTVTAEGMAAAGVTLARLKLSIDGALRDGKYTLETAGRTSKPFEVASAGTYAVRGNGAALKLATLRGRFGELPFAAAGPFTVTQKGDALEVTPVTLRVDGHPVTARAAISPKTVDIRVQTRGAPAAMLRHIPGAPKLEGTISASMSVTGSAQAPRGELTFEGKGLGTADTIKGKVPTFNVTGNGKIAGGALTFASRISGIGSAPFTAEGKLPFILSFAPFRADLPANQPISARLRGATDLAALQAIVPIGESRISGRGQVALDLAGTLSAPRISGTAAITKGRYESITTGSILAGIELRARGDGNVVRIERLTATDGSGGKMSGTGRINLIGGTVGAIEASVDLTRFRVVRLDQATVQVSGRTQLTGTPVNPRVSGKLTVNQAELSIAKPFAASVETIDVTVIGRDGKPRRIKEAGGAKPDRAGLKVALDFDVDVPNKAFVRGRGLDSEWKGKLKVTGTTAAPRINGKLEVVRGHISLLSKRFTIKSGTVAFAGGALTNPDIDFLAETKATNLTAQLRATGTAEKPTFTISSDPPLPQDEVLSRLLFNKEATKLSALQVVQLTRAAAELSGRGGGGLTDRLRSAAGLATLDFEGGENGKGGPSVKVGKYIGDKIYLSIQQGKSLDSSKVGVKVDITPNISVESRVDQAGDSDIGIIYRYDY
ncbi:MAG: translocation/assembly module TamB domain-containing protein [Alphaproteobacteria bacterium]